MNGLEVSKSGPNTKLDSADQSKVRDRSQANRAIYSLGVNQSEKTSG